MSILRLEAVRREVGDLVILDSVSGAVARGERIGLVGVNGAGKSTLLEVIAGREAPDAGRVHVARGTRLGLLAQEADLEEHFRGAPSVRAYVRGGAAELGRMERELAELEALGPAGVETETYATLRERFDAADGYHLDHRVEATLSGLGIARGHWGRRPAELSGGEQTRVALARLLIADPDLMMLDEPTNHLDLEALEWLGGALARRAGALLVASHDRAFLDDVVERIWELRDRRLTAFRGGYSAYLGQREAADARARVEAEAQVAAIAREAELVQRYRSQRKHVKVHEHERRLERLRAAAADLPRRSGALALPSSAQAGPGRGRSADVAVSLERVVCGYPSAAGEPAGRAIVRVERLELRRGERIGLVGPNGAGKSTLLRTIAGQLPTLEGFVRIGRGVVPGYLSQLRDRPPAGTTVLDAILAATPMTAGAARSYLARFLFRGDDVHKPVSELSGGEQSRLELALVGVGEVDLLLLDEPTNHLDIPSREALESFLHGSDATRIIVSHDRRLLESTCERLWVVERVGRDPDASTGSAWVGAPSIVAPFEGGYRDWRAAVRDGWTAADGPAPGSGRTARPAPDAVSADGPATRAEGVAVGARPRAASNGRPRLSKDAYRRERERIEADLARLGARKEALEAGLEDGEVQANFVELRRLTSELAQVDAALSQTEDAWLALEERSPA